MRRTIVAGAVTASLAAGAVAGAILVPPALAGAAETATGAAGWVQEALTGLVDDNTITQEQADSVERALEEAKPAHRLGHRGFAAHGDLSVVAESLGLTVDELRAARQDGQTLADVAGQQGVDVQAVVDAIVAAHQERLGEAVADGELTQEQADERFAADEERATALVNGDVPALHRGPHGHWGGPHGPHPVDFGGEAA